MKHKAVIAGIAVIVMIGAGMFWWLNLRTTSTDISPDDSYINYDPATEEERSAADLNKERIANQKEESQPNPPPDTTTKQPVTPIFGYLQQSENSNIEANGYISEAIEEGGTCTLVLVKNGVRATATKQARPSAQSTVCGLLAIERSKLSPGEWTATIEYSSSRYEGKSQERKVKVE